MNNPTMADHNSSTSADRGAEVFLYLFIFGGIFIALIGSAVGLYYLNKLYPNLLSDISKSLQESDKKPTSTNSYSNENLVTKNNRVVTINDENLDVHINNNTPASTDNDLPAKQEPHTPPTQQCYTYEIVSGELKSKRCYSLQDYDLLTNYYNKYQTADWSYDSANSSIKFLCDGSDFFEDACKDAKERKEEASDKKEKYLELSLAVIARGTPVN
jgi:hypothetical protein